MKFIMNLQIILTGLINENLSVNLDESNCTKRTAEFFNLSVQDFVTLYTSLNRVSIGEITSLSGKMPFISLFFKGDLANFRHNCFLLSNKVKKFFLQMCSLSCSVSDILSPGTGEPN